MKKALIVFFLLLGICTLQGQDLFLIQGLSFGTFIPYGQGSVTVHSNGERTVTGSLIPSGISGYTPAIIRYSLQKVKPFISYHIMYDPQFNLSYNGKYLPVQLGPSDKPGNMFTVLPNSNIDIKIGGTLFVNTITENPPGLYSGNFYITVIRE